ncbi:MAG: aminotransferase class IV [Actinobacteria bacterium]|nr:aminotransferase class IV [Actinomycetota bacterium]
MKFWVNDGLVEAEHASVSALDHGFTVADGVFETLAVRDGVPFALSRHLRRLATSAVGLGLQAPDADLVRRAALAVCRENVSEIGPTGRLRITYTSGPAPLGSERGQDGNSLVVAASASGVWPDTATVAVVRWPRNELSPLVGLKTTSYAENVVALAAAKKLGGSEALMANTVGELCEGTGSNVFVVVDDRLLTPPLSSGCLAGITRELLLEWCAEEMDVAEESLALDVLKVASEVLITSSTRDVQPVSRIVGEGFDRTFRAPGPITMRAAELFSEMAAESFDP